MYALFFIFVIIVAVLVISWILLGFR